MIDVDEAAEQGVLAALLVDPATWGEVEDIFEPDLFGRADHRAVAAGIKALIASEQDIEPVVLMGWLRDAGEPDAADLVLQLLNAVGTSAGARAYMERLRSVWARREVKRIAREAMESELEGEQLVAFVAGQVARLEVGRVARPRRLDQIILDRIDLLERQGKAGEGELTDFIPTGFRRLDDLIGGFRPGMPALISARPGVGKSALVSALLDNIASQGVPIGVFQLEDEAVALADRAIARRARINSTLLRHGSSLRPEHWQRIMEMRSDHPIFVDDDKGLTAREVAARMRRFVREHGVRLVVVDHLGELDMEYLGKNDRHDLAVGRALRTLRKAAHDLRIALVVCHQLNRDIDKRAADSTPRLSDLRDSGDLEAIARVIMFLGRPEPGHFMVDVAKNTNGPRGRAVLGWLEDHMAVHEINVA